MYRRTNNQIGWLRTPRTQDLTMNKDIVEQLFRELMEKGLGFDLSDPNLCDTPNRVARMYCEEFFGNCCVEFTDFKAFPNEHQYDQIIISDLIFFVSVCSHHFLPFTGNAWVLYIPKYKLVGASKMARLVEHYAARPQLQENLCHEVLNSFVAGIEPVGAMVVMRGIHGCMKCRGVKQRGSGMGTSAVYGAFKKPDVKSEGMDLIKLSLLDSN